MAGRGEIPEFSYQRRRQRPVVDPALRRIAMGAACLAAVIIGVALGWSGVKPHLGFGPPPEIFPPATPLRVAPADPGGLSVPEAEQDIMSGARPAAPAQLAPVAPAPDFAQFQAATGGPPLTAAPALPDPGAAPGDDAGAAPGDAPAANGVPGGPRVMLNGPIQVQLAAAADIDGVHKAWAQLQARMPGLLTGRTPQFLPAVVNGQNIYRLRVGGFADRMSADAFCAALVAKGAACVVKLF